MAEAGTNNYKIDLRALQFTLFEHLKVDQLFAQEAYAHLSREDCEQIITQCARFATEVTGPLNSPGDRTGCRLENGGVKTPAGFKDAWAKAHPEAPEKASLWAKSDDAAIERWRLPTLVGTTLLWAGAIIAIVNPAL